MKLFTQLFLAITLAFSQSSVASNLDTSSLKPYDISRIHSCLSRLDYYAQNSKNLMPVEELPADFQTDFSLNYLDAAAPDWRDVQLLLESLEGFTLSVNSLDFQHQHAQTHLDTNNAWFDAMDCSRDLMMYGIMLPKVSDPSQLTARQREIMQQQMAEALAKANKKRNTPTSTDMQTLFGLELFSKAGDYGFNSLDAEPHLETKIGYKELWIQPPVSNPSLQYYKIVFSQNSKTIHQIIGTTEIVDEAACSVEMEAWNVKVAERFQASSNYEKFSSGGISSNSYLFKLDDSIVSVRCNTYLNDGAVWFFVLWGSKELQDSIDAYYDSF